VPAPTVLTLEIAFEYLQRKAHGERPLDLAREFSERLGRSVTNPALLHYCDGHHAELTRMRSGREADFPSPLRKPWNTEPHLSGSWAIVSDLQIPSHDPEFIKRALDLCWAWGIPNVLVNGDWLNQDGASMKFDPSPDEADLSEEFAPSRAISGIFEDACSGMKVFVEGNHDVRIANFLRRRVRTGDVARMFLRDPSRWLVTGTTRAWVGNWLVCHPAGVSVIPGRYAQMLALKYGCPVVAAHGHLQGSTVAINGHPAIDSGMLADPARLAYAAYRTTARGMMAQGFVVLAQREEQGPIFPYAFRPGDDFAGLRWLYRPGDLVFQEPIGKDGEEAISMKGASGAAE
jgi:hypothetical protein